MIIMCYVRMCGVAKEGGMSKEGRREDRQKEGGTLPVLLVARHYKETNIWRVKGKSLVHTCTCVCRERVRREGVCTCVWSGE